MDPDETGGLLVGRSRTRQRILALLLDPPQRRLHLRAIARAVGTSAGTASRELRRLDAVGLVTRSAEGAQVYYQADLDPPLTEPMRAQPPLPSVDDVRASVDPLGLGIARQLASDLPTVYGNRLRGVYLYGSRARGDHRPDSDVDIVIVLDRVDDYGADLRRSSGLASEQSLEHGVTVTRFLVPEAIWVARDHPFVRSAAMDAISG
jgi:DNA-binding transcriptional ArsR family regulator